MNFLAAPLSGPDIVTSFCNGGTCDTQKGLCTTQPTFNPTSRVGTVGAAGICPGPVGGNTVTIDTTDLSQFTFIDQAPQFLSEPCQWTADSEGLKQLSNAWGNYPGDNIILGCIALIGTSSYTDFMVEVSGTHDDDDAWGFVFGYQQVTGDHWMAMANNDKWPDPPADDVRGPFSKILKTNGKPFENLAQVNASNNPYDTISYSDYGGRFTSDDLTHSGRGRFNIDGMMETDIPGEYYRTYPYISDTVWPDRKITLIVKGGEARLMVLGPDVTTDSPINNYRQPAKYAGIWTYQLADLGYTGGQIGLFLYAHQATLFNLTVTDLSGAMPTDYCGGLAGCNDAGVCTAVPVSDVCEDPADGVTSVDLTTLNNFDFIDSAEITTSGPCNWDAVDLGKGPFLYQSMNAHGSLEGIGCNALVKGKEYTDFMMQIDVDNYDNDGVGFIFGYKSELDHFKIHKRIDTWPSPSADGVDGPNLKVMKRIGEYPCINGGVMNETTACYQAVAFADAGTKDFFSDFIDFFL